MKYLMLLTFGVYVLVSPNPEIADIGDEAAVRRAMNQMDQAYNERDDEALLACMDEGFENWQGNHKGREVNVEAFLAGLKSQKNMEYKRFDEIGIVFVTPDVAIYKAHWKFSGMIDADGNALPPDTALGASVMVKRGGKWLLAAHFARAADE